MITKIPQGTQSASFVGLFLQCSTMYTPDINVLDKVLSEYSLYGHNNMQEMW
jgi:hypothetical protein